MTFFKIHIRTLLLFINVLRKTCTNLLPKISIIMQTTSQFYNCIHLLVETSIIYATGTAHFRLEKNKLFKNSIP